MNEYTIVELINKADAVLIIDFKAPQKATEYRYIIYGLLEKAGFTHQQIADHFKVSRAGVTNALLKLDVWIRAYKDIRENCQILDKGLLQPQ
jgi:ParB-like chromosome segregation protein Spo0J